VNENWANTLDKVCAGSTIWSGHRSIMVGRGKRQWCSRRVAYELLQEPADRMVLVPKGHGEGLKIPQDWAEHGERLGTQHHIVLRQGEREEVGEELIAGDRERRPPIHACAQHVLAIDHCDGCRAATDHGETGPAGNLHGDEVVRRARVDKSVDVDIA